MPVASSSRRKLRAEPSMEGIEESEPTQRRDEDDVDEDDEEEEEQAARRRPSKKNGRLQKRGSRIDGEKDAENDDGRIDVKNFRDQALGRKEGAKIAGISQDWETIRKQTHQSSYAMIKSVAISLADCLDGYEAEEALAEVDNVMRDLIDIEEEMLSHEATLKEIYQNIALEKPVEQVLDVYEKNVKKKLSSYRQKTSRQKYGKKEEYATFRQAIYEIQKPGSAIPPISEFLPKEAGDASDEEELEIGGITQDYRCPITLTTLVNPMTSKICGHSFSARAIQEFLGSKRKKCPASGCNKDLSFSDLQPDRELEKKVKIAARRAQRDSDDDDDDDEVVE